MKIYFYIKEKNNNVKVLYYSKRKMYGYNNYIETDLIESFPKSFEKIYYRNRFEKDIYFKPCRVFEQIEIYAEDEYTVTEDYITLLDGNEEGYFLYAPYNDNGELDFSFIKKEKINEL
jgi:hypothetical protein